MRFLIIRHAEPDYAHDSLTEKGFREAELLGRQLSGVDIAKIYVSPLGRAQRTAEPTALSHNITPVTLDWLREFPASVNPPYEKYGIDGEKLSRCPWNMLPQYWTKNKNLYDPEKWREDPLYDGTAVGDVTAQIDAGWDALTRENGYIRRGQLYDIEPGTDESRTVALFCHLGLGLALISRITGGALPFIWQTFYLPTSSVTTVYTEKYPPFERQCTMRIIGVGDVSHLARAGEPTSSSGLHSDIYTGRMF
ncbi:MAG: histidine phosphatase family protein [Eubacteriales bacterium]